MRFIDEHAAHTSLGRRWGIASICAVLTELGAPIAPSTYDDARRAVREPSAARRHDAWVGGQVARVHARGICHLNHRGSAHSGRFAAV